MLAPNASFFIGSQKRINEHYVMLALYTPTQTVVFLLYIVETSVDVRFGIKINLFFIIFKKKK